MQKVFTVSIFLAISVFAFGQNAGIGTTSPNPSAMLDVSSANKGMLIPRVALNAVSSFSPITGTPLNANALLVFNTTNNSELTSGYYYWNASSNKWIRLQDMLTPSTAWSTTGNAGLDFSTSFFGTIDNKPLRFKVNNEEFGGLWPTGELSIGKGAGRVLSCTGSQYGNNSFGEKALANISCGSQNTAIGSFSLAELDNGDYNTAIGFAALSNQAFDNSTAVGHYALNRSFAFGNTAVGKNALRYVRTGVYNSAIGFNAFPYDSGVSNYTGIGYYTGSTLSSGNMIELGNTSVSSIRGQVNFTTYSDKRIKKNIRHNVPGIAFLMKLQPVTYHLDLHAQNKLMYGDWKPDTATWAGKYDLENVLQTGFIAQDVLSAATEIGYQFNGLDLPAKDKPDALLGLRYADFVPVIVQAAKEQQAMLEALKQDNAAQRRELNELRAELKAIKKMYNTDRK